jgi:hypothetical protein
MIWVGVAAAAAGLLVLAERLWLAPEDQLTAEDACALPLGRVRLAALLERYLLRFVDPAVRGVRIDFLEEGKLLGSARTDARGSATIEVDAGPPGRRRFRVVSPRAEQALVVDVLPADAPILVLDLDHTVADVSPWRFAFADNRSVRPLPGAVEAIQGLAGSYHIVYLTARDHSFLTKTREWLRLRGLPDGPVFIRRRRFWSLSPMAHKLERLAEVARTHRLVAGVGDLPSDMEAYRRNGMTGYLMDPMGTVPAPEGVIRVRNWEELADRLRTGTKAT